jgi:hypothetical protein
LEAELLEVVASGRGIEFKRRAPPIPRIATAQGATQQTPNASAIALNPNAPVVTAATCGFSLV